MRRKSHIFSVHKVYVNMTVNIDHVVAKMICSKKNTAIIVLFRVPTRPEKARNIGQ